MKIAVVNLIGNIGKSTISSNLLFPRMGISDQDFISVETSKEPLHKSPTHVLAHACWVRQHPSLCSNSISA